MPIRRKMIVVRQENNKSPAVHFIGIGGIGMSALARYFLSQKCGVSGSDAVRSVITDSLIKDGVKVKIGQKAANVPVGAKLVVITQAVRPENPELKEARRRGLRILTYPQAVGELTDQYRTIAIAGAHGKSTTTALAALALVCGGLDPTVIIGTNLKELGSTKKSGVSGARNFRLGKGDYLVLEADEFGRAFLEYSPFIAVATNIDREHLDVYKNLAGAKKAFLQFFENVVPGGAIIVNRDDINLFSLRAAIAKIGKKKKARVIWYSTQALPKQVVMAKKIARMMQIPGSHNVSNAMAVHALGRYLKIPEKKVLVALASYRGSWRRFEHRGKAIIGGQHFEVFDDYAHHPTELKATLEGYKERFPGAKIVCVFQPHQAERLRLLFKDFITCFGDADILVLIPSYHVKGREKINSKFTAEKLAEAMKKKYPARSIFYLNNPTKLKEFLMAIIAGYYGMDRSKSKQKKPILIMMGAGDIVNYTDSLLCN